MTRRPPDPLPDPGPVPEDGTVLPGAAAVEAWHLAYLEHRRQVRIEAARYAAVCAEIREMFGPPSGTPRGETFPAQAWHQAGLDELDEPPLPGGEYVFRARDGTWIAADARHYLPPCELEG